MFVCNHEHAKYRPWHYYKKDNLGDYTIITSKQVLIFVTGDRQVTGGRQATGPQKRNAILPIFRVL